MDISTNRLLLNFIILSFPVTLILHLLLTYRQTLLLTFTIFFVQFPSSQLAYGPLCLLQ